MNFFRKLLSRSRKCCRSESKKKSDGNEDSTNTNTTTLKTHKKNRRYSSFRDLRSARNNHDRPAPPPPFNERRPSTAPSLPLASLQSQVRPLTHTTRPPRAPVSAAHFPPAVLSRIFTFVCPHSSDRSYLTAEETTTEGGCMLCSMRDLSRCALVCTAWHAVALKKQYTSIRLDNVHYCGLEEALEMRRKRGSFFHKRQDGPVAVPAARLQLLYRTLHENEQCAIAVQFLKMPYMTRETCKTALAQLVSLTPGLRYVDVPDGVFADAADCTSLKAILYARCPDLRAMKWHRGADRGFVDIWDQPPWPKLEVVSLVGLNVEDADLLRALRSLEGLKDLTLWGIPWLSDAAMAQLPPLERLTIEEPPDTVTAEGLSSYFSRAPELQHLTIRAAPSAILPQHLPALLQLLPRITSLSYATSVTRALPQHPQPPPLSSPSLKSLHFLITPSASAPAAARPPSETYYDHLLASLPHLPALCKLYVRDAQFHTRLAEDLHQPRTQELVLHEKKSDHQDWSRYIVAPGTTSNKPKIRGTKKWTGAIVDVKPLWDRPRNSLVASGEYLKVVGLGQHEPEELLAPPNPIFAGGKQGRRNSYAGVGLGGNHGHERSGSWSSLHSLTLTVPATIGGGDRADKRRSRQDLWR